MLEFITAVSVLSFVLFLVLLIINRKKDKAKAKRYGLFMIISFVLVIIFMPADADVPEQIDIAEQENVFDDEEGVAKEPIYTSTEPIEELEPTLAEQVYATVIETLGKSTNTNKDRIAELEVVGNYVSVELNGSENLTTNLMRLGLLRNSSELLEALSEYSEFDEFYISWMLPLVDIHGNSEDGVVMRITMMRDELEKINWDNFNTDNFSQVADVYWEHPALKN